MRGWIGLGALAACATNQAPSRPPQNVVFATSTVHTANLEGIAGADAICVQLAADAGLTGTYVAWISDTQTSAFSRIQDVRGGWVLVDGTPVATSPSELVTGSMRFPIARDERGFDVRTTQPWTWTGTGPDGTVSANCADWTSDDPSNKGETGDARAGGGAFSYALSTSCNAPRRLYCLETDRADAVVVAPAQGRYAFVTSESWMPEPAGIPGADALCQSDATAAGRPGNYLALLAPPNATAASRFDRSGAPWVNTAGDPLADPADRLFTAPYLSGFLRLADGTFPGDFIAVWGGDPLDNTAGAVCAGWTDPASAIPAVGGGPTSTDHGALFRTTTYPCNTAGVRLYCLEQ